MNQLELQRNFMKSNFDDPQTENLQSDQEKGLPQPPLQKSYDASAQIIKLPAVSEKLITETNVYSCMKNRRSKRKYKDTPLPLETLSFLLWATQGVDRVLKKNKLTTSSYRPVPSAGARHPFETYLIINDVATLQPGIYRYLHLTHELIFLHNVENRVKEASDAVLGQEFVANAPVIFVWSCIPYRGEWRYDICAHKAMLLDAGHICQNLYLACGATGCGTCAIAAYSQQKMDALLGIDGKDEFSVYVSPVGLI